MARKSRKNIAVTNEPEIKTAVYIRTAQYIRLSVEDSHNKGNSIENQKLILDDYIAQHPNMKPAGTYIDNGISGTTFKRPEFQRMLDDISAGNIDCVIVKDLSRLGRNIIDTGFYIERFFPEHKIRFIAVNDNIDTDNLKSNDSLMICLKNIINEAYALDIGKKIKTQARQAMREGQYVSARPRYGYLKDPNDCHKLIVNPETAPVVKMIFEWFVGGMSTTEICLNLTEKNILTPSIYGYNKGYITSKKSVGQNSWTSRTVRNILEQEIYTGKLVQGKTDTIAHKQTPRDKSEWIIVENTHEAIISQELFDKAQVRLALLKNKHSQKTSTPYTENLFKGKIYCGHCGRALNRHKDCRSGKYHFCCLTNQRYKRGGCENGIIYENELLQVIMASLKAQASVLIENKNILSTSMQDQTKNTEITAEIKRLKTYISQNQNFLSSLYENLVNGIISPEEYQTMRRDYGDKISDAVKKMHDAENKKKAFEQEYNRYQEMDRALELLFDSGKFTKEIIDKLISKVVIYKGKRVEITYNFENEFESEVQTNG